METILIALLVIIAITVVALVLIQHGKGADIGAAFGSGASSTVFGSQGSTSFLSKFTFGLAAVFFIICIVLTSMASRAAQQNIIIAPQTNNASVPVQNNSGVPAVPAPVDSKQTNKK